MAKRNTMKIIRRVTLDRVDVLSRDVPTYSAAAMRDRLTHFAIKFYGDKDRDWQMVDDPGCLFPFHVRALRGACEGETLEIQ